MSRFAIFVTTLFAVALPASGATTLFTNARIQTMDAAASRAEWMAVTDGRITGIGKGKPPARFAEAERVDLGGKWVIPSLTDAHAHITDMGLELTQVDLRGAKSAEEAAARVRARAEASPGKGTIVGNGWDQTDWPGKAFPTRHVLDAAVPNRPVVLYRIDGHAAWLNTAALQRTEAWKSKGDPEGGRILRNADGVPTGILVDRAMRAARPLLADPSDAEVETAVRAAVNEALSHGITSIHDAGATRQSIEAMRRLLRDGKVNFRFYELVSARDEEDLDYYLKRGPEIDGENGRLTVRAVKLFADGAMGSRGALFEKPYNDDPSTSGLWVQPYETLVKTMKRIDGAGFQIAVHAIGSLANGRMLDAFESVLGKSSAAKRPRLEHAQVLRGDDLPRIARLGVIASMQPVHCTSDMKWVVDRIGKERARYAYAWRALLDAGVPLAFGSDAPVEAVNPWHGLYAAVTRQTAAGEPPGGFFPEQRIRSVEALRGFTAGAAFAAFVETRRGTLETGKDADFVVTAADPLSMKPKALRAMKVEATYVGGRKAWPQPPSPAG